MLFNQKDQAGEELLEVWDWDTARPTGRSITRKAAHEQSVPHEGVHLWVVRNNNGSCEIILQRRALHKDNYPGVLDISVGGHVPFGLSENKIHKEAQEELGIVPDDEHLVFLGTFRYEEYEIKYHHREFQQIYLLFDNRPLSAYAFNDGEVSEVVALPVTDLEFFFNGDRIICTEAYNGHETFRLNVSRKDIHPLLFAQSMAVYMHVLLQAIKEFAFDGAVKTNMPSIF